MQSNFTDSEMHADRLHGDLITKKTVCKSGFCNTIIFGGALFEFTRLLFAELPLKELSHLFLLDQL